MSMTEMGTDQPLVHTISEEDAVSSLNLLPVKNMQCRA